jgi:hypothetical protein
VVSIEAQEKVVSIEAQERVVLEHLEKNPVEQNQ